MTLVTEPGRPKILVVLASEIDLEALHTLLGSSCELTCSRSISEVVAFYAQRAQEGKKYDVALIEDEMPDGNGLFLLQYLRYRDPEISLAMISESCPAETIISALQLNAYEFIRKPLVPKVVLAAVTKGIRRTFETRQLAKRLHVGDAAAQLAHDVASIVTVMSFQQPNDPIIQHSVNRIVEMYSHFRKTQNGALFFRVHSLAALVSGSHKDLLDWLRANQSDPTEVILSEMPPCRISVDRIYFTRVLENLLRNAVQSMEGVVGRAKQVHISAKTENERAYISIRDTGIGMPPEIISRIFDPYFTTRSQGTGLGLHICRQFVQDMKGEISLESTVNQGTTFTISFPIVAAEPDFPFS